MRPSFPENYLAAIGSLSMAVRAAPPRAAVGTHLSRANGASLQFRDYQAYTPGDDLRRVDWAVYGRTRHLFVRRFERPTAMPVFILVDASESMKLESPSRYATAARVAAAIASAALSSQNPVYLMVGGGRAATMPRALTGRRSLVRALADLAEDRPLGGAGVAQDVAALLPMLAAKGPGVLTVISDFFDDDGLDHLIDTLRQVPDRLALVRVTQPGDANPELGGDLELADCETGATLQVSPGQDVLSQYRNAYRTYFDALEAYARSRSATMATFDASAETLPQLESLFPAGVMTL